uniref:Beta-glucuronidase C-terminal domain-containing protein n=1 Tax=Chlamydomonas leiostraca TaxID=1034604 RepID=A0A7S0RHN0_9CHLO|mmetsp:Transcript_23087/g.58979  ORF Transcript_23087/g.58979 Transcript_23087/m.58979 type:complete len:680 (+) Transcript_23087:19-2058(+)|eukprot:CAMPEP_0202869412 /NCGR_PEP_ID=MMETSP1391-20130828/12435_1 /ASSEMBLY_ACC=CAM_ASM_000867 /TAXON_ID=1034604 /ORGANISM="Chlamydomonas leiostraca, Strain SAG 11-49" /LENGTH=679 /DNA_ID=CAMNT_0049549725 /DNA_START=19 /DNA_END=2058 /DNA_ORIENTATION=-
MARNMGPQALAAMVLVIAASCVGSLDFEVDLDATNEQRLRISPGYLGLSVEPLSQMQLYARDDVFRQLITNLAELNAGPFNIRIGGSMQDFETFDTPADTWKAMKELWEHVDKRLSYTIGLNLMARNTSHAVAQVKSAARVLPPEAVASLAVGNEPDSFGSEELPADNTELPPRTKGTYLRPGTPGGWFQEQAVFARALAPVLKGWLGTTRALQGPAMANMKVWDLAAVGAFARLGTDPGDWAGSTAGSDDGARSDRSDEEADGNDKEEDEADEEGEHRQALQDPGRQKEGQQGEQQREQRLPVDAHTQASRLERTSARSIPRLAARATGGAAAPNHSPSSSRRGARGSRDDSRDDDGQSSLNAEQGIGPAQGPYAKVVSCHKYAANANDERHAKVAHLVADTPHDDVVGLVGRYAAEAHKQGLQFRLDETNSLASAGKAGVSDTLAGALFVVDTALGAARAGSQGVNFHAAGCAPYSPILLPPYCNNTGPLPQTAEKYWATCPDTCGQPDAPAIPSAPYYGLWLVQRALAGAGRSDAPLYMLSAAAIKGPKHPLARLYVLTVGEEEVRLVLVNRATKGHVMDVTVALKGAAANELASGRLVHLRATDEASGLSAPYPSLLLGGQTIDQATGKVSGKAESAKIMVMQGADGAAVVKVPMPPASAALLVMAREKARRDKA